jgi:hypothetical protein
LAFVELAGATEAVAAVVVSDVGTVDVGLATAMLVHIILKTASMPTDCEIVRMNLDKSFSPSDWGG